MKEKVREEPKILAAAERQMHAFALSAEIEDRAVRADDPHRLSERVGNFVAVSRETGADGSEIARLVGQRLGWKVLDRDVLDLMADRYGLSKPMLAQVDETRINWAYDILGTWMDPHVIAHDKYVSYLGRVVLEAARQENVVLVGRGAQFFLPREKGLAVRIVAPKQYRIRRTVEQQGLTAMEAERSIDEKDRGRREFVQRFFHHDIDDPYLYDLVINTERLGPARAAEQIVTAMGG